MLLLSYSTRVACDIISIIAGNHHNHDLSCYILLCSQKNNEHLYIVIFSFKHQFQIFIIILTNFFTKLLNLVDIQM